jgi:alpha/beta superfamily hydrolase
VCKPILTPGRIGTLLFLADSAIKSSSMASFARGSQVKLSGSRHFFDGKEDELVESVAGWLEKLADK